MTDGLLLDTHVLLWLESQSPIDPQTAADVFRAGAESRLFMSDISIWEFGVAVHKKSLERRPNLQGLTVQQWFSKTSTRFNIRALRISSQIALEAANVPGVYGSGDPGDCFLIATARVRGLSLVTRDTKIVALARREPNYCGVVPC